MRRTPSPAALTVLCLLLVGFLGMAGWTGIVTLPGFDRLHKLLEAGPAGARPGAEFYRAAPAERTEILWGYLDDGAPGQAYRGALELAETAPPGAPQEEVVYLLGLLAARHLDRPWHAVVHLQDYLGAYPGGRYAATVRLTLAETLLQLEQGFRSLDVLEAGATGLRRADLEAEARALLAGIEARLADPDRLTRMDKARAILVGLVPNNPRSLLLSLIGFVSFLMPSLFKVGLRFHDASAAEQERLLPSVAAALRRAFGSRVYRWLFAAFALIMLLQYRLNQAQAAQEQAEVRAALKFLRATFGE